jgi:cob(I)alamin adenosyltransferase
MGFLECIIVEVKFIMTKLPAETILMDVGICDGGHGARAETPAKRIEQDFDVILSKHSTDYTQRAFHKRYNARMSFYTSKGDDGTTNLLGEGRVTKYHARIEAVGTLDESSAALGLARAQCLDPRSSPILLEAQRDLYKMMAEVAATPDNANRFRSIDDARVKWLEQQTDLLSEVVEMPKEFILPGDSLAGAALSLGRAVIRRAERRVVELFDEQEVSNPDLQRYLNRLSSLCFVLELLENKAAGHKTSFAKA